MANNRKKVLINPKFQLNYIKHTVVLSLLVLATFYFSTLMHFNNFKSKGIAAGLPEDHIFFEFIKGQQSSMDILFLVSGVIAILVIVGYGVYLSHRVAGPLYRLQKYLEESQEGGPEKPLKFREGDYFGELADAINRFTGQNK